MVKKLVNGWFFAKFANVRTLQSFPPYGICLFVMKHVVPYLVLGYIIIIVIAVTSLR